MPDQETGTGLERAAAPARVPPVAVVETDPDAAHGAVEWTSEATFSPLGGALRSNSTPENVHGE